MAKFSPLMALPPLLFAGLAGLFLYGMNREDPDQLPSAQAGNDAPNIAMVTPLGDRAPLSDEMLRAGEVKLVNFWASWCAPCRAEHAQLETLAAEGIDLYGINYKDRPEDADAFLTELGDPFAAIGADQPGRAALDWGLYGVPETFVLTPEGKIAFRFAGPITVDIMENIIKPEIAKAAQ